MAGSLPGVPLSQQFDANGDVLSGALLYIYAANTTTPQDSFLDSGLTIKNTFPLKADARGRVPMFYLADGAVHVRLTDSAGVVQFDYPSMLVIGPSSGGGGGGGGDPTTIFQTGDVLWLDAAGLRAGWVRDNGRTIGNAVSGASERANADTQALYVFGWALGWTVVGGAGANALADFNAGKQLTLPDKRGYLPGGLDDMGNAAAGRYAGVPFSSGNATTPGSLGGEAAHTLSAPEIPAHTHGITEPNGGLGHAHPPLSGSNFMTNGAGQQVLNVGFAQSAGNATTGFSITGITINANTGGGAHNNTPLVTVGTFYRKL